MPQNMSGNHLHLHAQNILSLLGAKNNVSTIRPKLKVTNFQNYLAPLTCCLSNS